MSFNSITFAIFLPIVFAIYWLLRRQLRWQNLFVVIASYVFYGWWDWRFLILIAITSLCSWGSGLLMERDDHHKKVFVVVNVVVNLLILCVFKYFNFFVDSFCTIFNIQSSITLNLILPVGISFYTFQALSYSIDVYREKLSPTHDPVAFFAYVAFFPQLVAGPIERATNLLPQFERERTFDYDEAVDGVRRILWGLFKKMVVADNCAAFVNNTWSHYGDCSGSTLALAAILFSFQIYGDFSGYSDIAIGTARLFGIRLKDNFRTPFFSRNMAEFWKRWHISLNTWFVDYVYIPLGGSREGMRKTIRNILIMFVLSGLWHGANWTYVTWGLFNAVLLISLIIWGRTKAYTGNATWREIPQMLLTFALFVIGCIIFRAPSIADAWHFMCGLMEWDTFRVFYRFFTSGSIRLACCSIIFMLVFEWVNRHKSHPLQNFEALPILRYDMVRIVLYVVAFYLIIFLRGGIVEFFYFQF